MGGVSNISFSAFSRVGWWVLFGAMLPLGLGGLFSAKPAYRRYRAWRASQLAERAERLLAANDTRGATILASQAMQLLPVSLQANRAMANVTTRQGDPIALIYWRNVTNLARQDKVYWLEYAKATLRFGQPAAAHQILDEIKPEFGDTIGWLTTASGCALAGADFDTALGYLRRIQQLEPRTERHQLNYASAALFSLNPSFQREGVMQLERFTGKSAFAPTALRNLAFYYRRTGASVKSLSYWDEINRRDVLTWQERIYYLDLIRNVAPARAPGLLERYRVEAETQASSQGAYELAAWFFRNGRPQECEDLLTMANVELREPAFHFLMADALIDLRDWGQLELLFRNPIASYREYLRYALLALSEQRQGRVQTQMSFWEQAMRLTDGQVSRLLMLADVAQEWGWENRAVDIWRRISQGQETPEVGFRYLLQYYTAKKDKRGFRDVLEALHERYPSDLAFANDLADLDMLYHQNLPRAYQLAELVYRQDPHQIPFAATYGLALLFQRRFQEAEKVYGPIADALNQPNLKLNYGMILTANGKAEAAKKWLDAVDPNRLEPEEFRWLTRTRQQAEVFSAYPLQLRYLWLDDLLQKIKQVLLGVRSAIKALASNQQEVLAGAALAATG